MRRAAISIDLDPLVCYYAIHGLKAPEIADDPILTIAFDRLLKLLAEQEVKATFFVTGLSLTPEAEALVKKACAAGHEIANHSYAHDYRLSLENDETIYADITAMNRRIEALTGKLPKGFRAPGYNTTPAMVRAIGRAEFAYDSSLFPSPAYYLAKSLIITVKKLLGKPSRSIITSFFDAFGRQKPYRFGSAIRHLSEHGPVELPITTVCMPLGLPLIGTSLITFPQWLVRLMLRYAVRRNYVNIELHGIDAADCADHEAYAPLNGRQPDLSVPLKHKIERITRAIQQLKASGFIFMPLAAIAAEREVTS